MYISRRSGSMLRKLRDMLAYRSIRRSSTRNNLGPLFHIRLPFTELIFPHIGPSTGGHVYRRADGLFQHVCERRAVVRIASARERQPRTCHRRAKRLHAADFLELFRRNAERRKMFIQTTYSLGPLKTILSEGQAGARNNKVVVLDHTFLVELQFVIDRLIYAVHFCKAFISRPVNREAEDICVGRPGEDSQDDSLSRKFRRQFPAKAITQFLRAADAGADEHPVTALIERDDAVREPAGRRRRAGLGTFQDVPANERAISSLFAVKNVWRFGRDQLLHFFTTENYRAARVRDVAELVRINRHRVGVMNGAEALEDLVRRPGLRYLADRAGSFDRPSLPVEEEGSDVAAPSRVTMVIKGQPLFSHFGLKFNQAMNLVNSALFRRAKDRNQRQNRPALVCATQKYFPQSAHVRAEVAVDRNHFDLFLAHPQSFNDLPHRVVRRRGNKRQRGCDLLVSQLREEALNSLARDAVSRQ